MLAVAKAVWALLFGVAGVVLIGIIIGIRMRGRRKAD
jgi:hypothetical protein